MEMQIQYLNPPDGARPNKAEQAFLNIAYNRFYDLYDEILEPGFFDKESWYRFSKMKEGFAIYTELSNYEPIKWQIEQSKNWRPPFERDVLAIY